VNNGEKCGAKDVRDFGLPKRDKQEHAILIELVMVEDGTETYRKVSK
jgi:hypothetical protein